MLVTDRVYFKLNELQPTEAVQFNFSSLFNYWGITFTDTTTTNKLYKHICEQYGEDYCVYIDIRHPSYEYFEIPSIDDIMEDYELKRQVTKFLNKIKNWVEDSLERYETLINLYEAKKNDLLAKVKTESKNKFNDTPQTTETGLDGDGYATTYTVNTLESDSGTVMARLEEVRTFWTSLWEEWTQEYSKKFVIY